jgi:hypothetical protein
MDEQRAWFKQARQAKHHDRYDQIELWVSDVGRTITHRFRPEAVALVVPVAPASDPGPTVEPVAPVPSDGEAKAPAPDPQPIVESGSQDASGDFDVDGSNSKRRQRK